MKKLNNLDNSINYFIPIFNNFNFPVDVPSVLLPPNANIPSSFILN